MLWLPPVHEEDIKYAIAKVVDSKLEVYHDKGTLVILTQSKRDRNRILSRRSILKVLQTIYRRRIIVRSKGS